MIDPRDVVTFSKLFTGFPTAFGVGTGGWSHRAPRLDDYRQHLEGDGPGLGIGPLMPDDKCNFAAIDLDRPDFDLATQMMQMLPGASWLERSRSGNAHVLVFFEEPVEAWIPRGIMREVLLAVNERNVEVFPKTDHLLPGMVGNYLNLPYYGDTRPVVGWFNGKELREAPDGTLPLTDFLRMAHGNRNDPMHWRKRADWLKVPSPKEREIASRREFGTSPNLHICAVHVLANRFENPVVEGHRAVVFFSLAKMLSNWSQIDHDEALQMMAEVNDASPDPIPADELRRILFNAERRGYTSTGCDDPLFEPYRHPDCEIGA